MTRLIFLTKLALKFLANPFLKVAFGCLTIWQLSAPIVHAAQCFNIIQREPIARDYVAPFSQKLSILVETPIPDQTLNNFIDKWSTLDLRLKSSSYELDFSNRWEIEFEALAPMEKIAFLNHVERRVETFPLKLLNQSQTFRNGEVDGARSSVQIQGSWMRTHEYVIAAVKKGEDLQYSSLNQINKLIDPYSRGLLPAGVWRSKSPSHDFLKWSPEFSLGYDPRDVKLGMDRLFHWYYRNKGTLHPIALASVFIARLIVIHPYANGNGRTARAALNWILMDHGYPPPHIERWNLGIHFSNQPEHQSHMNWDTLLTTVTDGINNTLDQTEFYLKRPDTR